MPFVPPADLLRDESRVALTRHWPELDARTLPVRLVIENKWTGLSALSPMIRRHELVLENGRYRGVFIAIVGGMSSAAGQITGREERAESVLAAERVHGLLDSLREVQVMELSPPGWPKERVGLLRAFMQMGDLTESHDHGLLALHFGARTLCLEREAGERPWWLMNDGSMYPVAGPSLSSAFELLCAGLDEAIFEPLSRRVNASVIEKLGPEFEEACAYWAKKLTSSSGD